MVSPEIVASCSAALLRLAKGSFCRGVCGPVLDQALNKFHFPPFLSVSCALQASTEQENSMHGGSGLYAVSNTGHWLSTST